MIFEALFSHSFYLFLLLEWLPAHLYNQSPYVSLTIWKLIDNLKFSKHVRIQWQCLLLVFGGVKEYAKIDRSDVRKERIRRPVIQSSYSQPFDWDDTREQIGFWVAEKDYGLFAVVVSRWLPSSTHDYWTPTGACPVRNFIKRYWLLWFYLQYDFKHIAYIKQY